MASDGSFSLQVKDVKQRILEDQGDAFPTERTMVIYQGKVRFFASPRNLLSFFPLSFWIE